MSSDLDKVEELTSKLVAKSEQVYELSNDLATERGLRHKVEAELTRTKGTLAALKDAAEETSAARSPAPETKSAEGSAADQGATPVRSTIEAVAGANQESRLLAVAEKKVKILERELRQAQKALQAMRDEEKRKMSLAARGEDEASLKAQELKQSNLNLFSRLASAKKATKAAEATVEKRDRQICVLTEHVEKLMITLRNEGEAKKNALLKVDSLAAELEVAKERNAQLAATNRRLSRHASSVDKQDKMMEKQLQVVDAKYQALYRTHQTSKANAAKTEANFAKQIEQVSGWVWTSKQRYADVVTARNNTLLGVLKLYESVFGKMRTAVVDLQETGLDDEGARALARTIEATVGRMNQRDEAKERVHATRVDSWEKSGKGGPLPFWGKADNHPRRSCVLNLSFNEITDKGLKPLMVALAKCRHITEVDIRGNRVTRKSLPYIVHALVYNVTLEAIDMSGNKFSKVDLAEYLSRYTAAPPHPQVASEDAAPRADQDAGKAGSKGNNNASADDDADAGVYEDESASASGSDSESGSLGDHDEDDDEEDPEEAELQAYPVLSTNDKAKHSMFRFHARRRSRSAPPRQRITPRELQPDAWLPQHEAYSQNPKSRVDALRRADIMRSVSRARLYPPKQSPLSAAARISLDSISTKMAHANRRVRPRPETAMVSRFGGQELPLVSSPTKRSNLTSSGKVKFSSGRVKQRLAKTKLLQEASSRRERPRTAAGRLKSQASPGMLSPVRTGRPQQRSRTPTAKEMRRQTPSWTPAQSPNVQYAPEDMQVAFKFARRGDVAGILNLMKQLDNSVSFHANMRQLRTGETATMHAARTGQADMIRLMLEKGADINAVSNEGWSALHHAVDAKQSGMVKFLLQYRADPNQGADEGVGTALHLAVRLNRLEAVCILLDASGIDLKAKDGRGRTPQALAAQRKHNQVKRLLIEAIDGRRLDEGGDPKVTAKAGEAR